MDTIYDDNVFKISKENTLILGATVSIKKKIKKALEDKYSVIDDSYSYSTKTVGESIANYNFNINNLKDIEEKEINELTFDEYYFLALLLQLSTKPRVLVIDNLFGFLNNKQKANIVKTANKNGIILIIFDNELYTAYEDFDVIVVHEGKTAIQGEFKDVVLQEKILKRLGYELPFYVDLSTQLKLFNLIGSVCYTKEELEGKLWK